MNKASSKKLALLLFRFINRPNNPGRAAVAVVADAVFDKSLLNKRWVVLSTLRVNFPAAKPGYESDEVHQREVIKRPQLSLEDSYSLLSLSHPLHDGASFILDTPNRTICWTNIAPVINACCGDVSMTQELLHFGYVCIVLQGIRSWRQTVSFDVKSSLDRLV